MEKPATDDAVQPLPPLTGNLWVPVWAVRPGAYGSVAHLAVDMPLWLLLHSRNTDYSRPCYASRESLGVSIGISRAKVSRQLASLRKAHLVFRVERGVDRRTKQHLPPARWALDPFAVDLWRPEVEVVLAKIAEEDGHDGRWYTRAVTSLDAFERRSRLLALKIAEDMPVKPKQNRRRKKTKKGKKKRAATQIEPSTQNEPQGEVFTTGRVVEEEGVEHGPERDGNRSNKNGRRRSEIDSTTDSDSNNITPPLDSDADPRQAESPTHKAA